MQVIETANVIPEKFEDHRSNEDTKAFGRWLNRAICLRPNRKTSKHEVVELAATLYDELGLGGYKRAAKESALNCILSNLYLGNWLGEVPVMFPRGSERYSIPKRYRYGFFTRRIVLPIIEGLEGQGLIEIANGCNDLSRMSRMWPTEELLKRLAALAVKDIEKLPQPDPIIMRKRVRNGNDFVKESIDYKDTAKTREMRRFLHLYNRLMDKVTVKVELPPEAPSNLSEKALLYFTVLSNGVHLDDDTKRVLKTLKEVEGEVVRERYLVGGGLAGTNCSITCDYKSLHRVFNHESWERGGRFYGCEVQNLPKELRRYVTLNGEPTVELDYSSMHLRMLYHLRGHEAPDVDLYDFGVSRDLNKKVVLIIINCEPEQDEVRAIAHAFNKDKELRNKFGDSILTHDFVRGLIADFKAAHPTIADDFFSGCGLRLQYKDSMIMEDMLKHFVGKQVPIIPVHDSLIVPVGYAGEARQIMKQTYKSHMGFDAVVG